MILKNLIFVLLVENKENINYNLIVFFLYYLIIVFNFNLWFER